MGEEGKTDRSVRNSSNVAGGDPAATVSYGAEIQDNQQIQNCVSQHRKNGAAEWALGHCKKMLTERQRKPGEVRAFTARGSRRPDVGKNQYECSPTA